MAKYIESIENIKKDTTLIELDTGTQYKVLGIINNEAAVITADNPKQFHIDDLKRKFIIAEF